MSEPHTHPHPNQQPTSVPLPASPQAGEQRRDVPYHWPRGQEAPSTPAERRVQRGLIGLVVVLSVSALALLWYMIAQSTRAF